MAHRATWDSSYEAIPADNSQASNLGTVIRNLKQDVRERGEVDHDWDDTANAGKHNRVTLQQLGAKPTASTDEAYLYQKDVGGNTEVFIEDETGAEIQLTVGGEVNAAAISEWATALILSNNIGLQGTDTAAAAKNIAKLNASDIFELCALDYPTTIKTDDADGVTVEYGSGEKIVFHEGKMGAGSTLDADLVDGIEAEDIFSSLGAGRFFESAEKATTDAGDGVEAHGLGSIPNLVIGVLRCKTAEHGYTADDEIMLGWGGIGSANRGISFGADVANIFWTVASQSVYILHKTAGSHEKATPANWKLVVRAWK